MSTQLYFPETRCLIPGCDRIPQAQGRCHSHYEYRRRTGKDATGPIIKRTAEDRFWAKVEKREDCWIWIASTASQGRYGRFEERQAHAWAYEHFIGAIPDGCEIDHLCRVTLCVNPAHLEPVTHRVNILRGLAPTALNAAKTHCKRGHADWIVGRNGHRRCGTCEAGWNAVRLGRGRNHGILRADALDAYFASLQERAA